MFEETCLKVYKGFFENFPFIDSKHIFLTVENKVCWNIKYIICFNNKNTCSTSKFVKKGNGASDTFIKF